MSKLDTLEDIQGSLLNAQLLYESIGKTEQAKICESLIDEFQDEKEQLMEKAVAEQEAYDAMVDYYWTHR